MAHTSQHSLQLQTQQHIGRGPHARTEPVPFQEALEEVGTLLAFAEGDEETTDPRAEGACLFDLTPEEWRFVRNAPLTGFLMVAGADGTVLPRERRALVRALEQGKSASCEIFRAVCRELYRQRNTLMGVLVSDTFEREQLSEAYRLVSGNLGAEEAERFKECLLKLGRQVAKASGGLIASWGGLRGVERRALAELATAFGPGR
jgi:hypothetical protein